MSLQSKICLIIYIISSAQPWQFGNTKAKGKILTWNSTILKTVKNRKLKFDENAFDFIVDFSAP